MGCYSTGRFVNLNLFVQGVLLSIERRQIFAFWRGPFFSGLPALGALLLLAACSQAPDVEEQDVATPSFVTRSVCSECHAEEVAAWTGSDHDRAMQRVSPETVRGDFDDISFTHEGIETRFFREGDRFLVLTEGLTGARDTFQVKYTFGYEPLQQYLVEFPDGRLQALTVAWDAEKERWFTLYPDERIPPGDFVHWTGRGMTWNHMCASCHSTNLQKNFDLDSNTYHTTFSEIDVSCEACHGPGEAHVAWARQSEKEREDDPQTGLTVDLSSPAQVETCAPCHSRRQVVAADFVPGRPYLDHYVPELLREGLYFPDGQIQDEVFVYGSFMQSKMYHAGVRCTNCHDPHTTQIKLEGNALCTQCHAPAAFDTPEHFHHEEGSPGAQCVSCHMPERTYMLVDPRRDHSFKVPRPDLTLELGVPNACNGCHTGRSAEWARDQVVAWYGPERDSIATHAVRTIAAGRKQDPSAEESLQMLAKEEEIPAITRATAVSLLAGYNSEAARMTLRRLLRDPAPLVRVAAVRSFESMPDAALYPALSPLLTDSVRAVRVEAARLLSRVLTPRSRLGATPEQLRAFERALAEYRQSQEEALDQPEAQMNLGVLHEQQGDPGEAEAAYRAALRLDSTYVPARLNLAMLLNGRRSEAQRQGGRAEAQRLSREVEAHLRTAVRQQSDLPEAHYTLGLLLAEQPTRMTEAARHLSKAAELGPGQARVQYNTGLIYQHLGEAAKAEQYLLRANRLEPQHPDYLQALAILYMQQKQWREALLYTDRLLEQVPNVSDLMQQRAYILRQIREK